MKKLVIITLIIVILIVILINNRKIDVIVKYSDKDIITNNYKIDNYNIYYVSIDSLKIKYKGSNKELKYYLKNNLISIDRALNKIDKDNVMVISCNNDIIFGKKLDTSKYCNGINKVITSVINKDNKYYVSIDNKDIDISKYNLSSGKVNIYYDDDYNIISINKLNSCDDKC